MYLSSIITGVGSYIPNWKVSNKAFEGNEFYLKTGEPIDEPGEKIIQKFQSITGIENRRYAEKTQMNSDLAIEASKNAIADANINPNDLGHIIVAHNYGDVQYGTFRSDIMPSIASRVKNGVGCTNEDCVAYDIIFGCPGWVQALIQAHIYLQAGEAKHVLVVGSETLSRVTDPHDRDTMIFADGAGAVVLSAVETQQKVGIIAHAAVTHAEEELNYLYNGGSCKLGYDPSTMYIKMDGRKIYEYALTKVPAAMKKCIDKSGMDISALKMIFLHQANEKMDEAILKRFFRQYRTDVPEKIMPMSIKDLGNSSVATVPTLYDLVKKDRKPGYNLQSGDFILFASVGAGMNINAVGYLEP